MSALMAHNSSHKRKRDAADLPQIRAAPGLSSENDFTQQYINDDVTEPNDNGLDFLHAGDDAAAQRSNQTQPRAGQSVSDTATAALAQYHTMTVPQPTEQTFLNQATENGDRSAETGDQSLRRASSYGGEVDLNAAQAEGESSPSDLPARGMNANKPAVGSDEWHKVRRDNHKEVERRRRETINEGINALQAIIPGCEKNKGSILARAAQFITQLKANETANIEKWTLEKMLTETAIAELSDSCDKLKAECRRAWEECEQWKKAAQKAGVQIDDKDGIADDE